MSSTVGRLSFISAVSGGVGMIEGRRFICGSLRDYGRRLYKPPMQYVLTVIGDPRSRPLTAALVDSARSDIARSRSPAGPAPRLKRKDVRWGNSVAGSFDPGGS